MVAFPIPATPLAYPNIQITETHLLSLLLFLYSNFALSVIQSLQVQGMHTDVSALKKASIWHEASRIVNEEGFKAFWKGNLVMIAHRLPYSAVSFYAYERYKRVSYLMHTLPVLSY